MHSKPWAESQLRPRPGCCPKAAWRQPIPRGIPPGFSTRLLGRRCNAQYGFWRRALLRGAKGGNIVFQIGPRSWARAGDLEL
eukprot:scaffold7360_cov270-Pinguiococcus_pyrenoidosus.AAC.4